jgi:hypothetical protein
MDGGNQFTKYASPARGNRRYVDTFAAADQVYSPASATTLNMTMPSPIGGGGGHPSASAYTVFTPPSTPMNPYNPPYAFPLHPLVCVCCHHDHHPPSDLVGVSASLPRVQECWLALPAPPAMTISLPPCKHPTPAQPNLMPQVKNMLLYGPKYIWGWREHGGER